jgi:hypothetical protein
VAFTAFNADADNDFAIVALVDIPANTTLYFTDNEPNAAGDGVESFDEGTLEWVSGGSVITAGSIIVFTDVDDGANTNFGASIGTLSVPAFDAGLSLDEAGDALYCVEGSPDGDNILAWLAGIQNASGNQGANFAATGLTVGTTFIDFYSSGSPDGGEYTGARSGESAFADYLPLLGSNANWTVEDTDGEAILPISTEAFILGGGGGGTFSPGDVAFTAFNADGNDDFAIVALVDIPANTTLYFSDNEPNATGDGFEDFNEGSLQWESGASVISAGTIVVFTDTDNEANTNFGASIGTLSATTFDVDQPNLAGGGDALYCVEGNPDGDNIVAWLAGIANASSQAGTNFGATGLTVGTTFIDFFSSGSPDGGAYNGSRNSETAFADYLPLLGNNANWITETDNGELLLPISTVPFSLFVPPSTTTWTGGNATSDWTDPLNWDNGVPTPASTVNIPAPDAGVTIYPELAAAATVTEIHILGNASGSGSMLGNANLTVTGAQPTFQSFITGGNTTKDDPNALYHFISSPVLNPTAISIFPGSAYIRAWNEPTQEWMNLTGTDPLEQNKGYTIWLPDGNITATYTGAWTSGDKPVSGLSYTAGGPTPGFDGYNLVGNPYPSGLDWDLGSWTKTNLDATIAIWNGATGNYYYWNGTVGNIANGVIPPAQGFFVKASAAPSLTIPENGRVNSGLPMYKSEVENLLAILVEAASGQEDQLFVHFNDAATNGYDAQFDGQKMYGLAAAPQIFTPADDGTELAINTLPYDATKGNTLPVHVLCGEDASFTLSASELESFNNGTSIYLEDMKTGGMINLMEQDVYNFDYSTSDEPVRFTLHFEVAFGTPDLEAQSNISVYAANHNIYLTSDEAIFGEIQVFNLMGQQISVDKISGNTASIPMISSSGQYIVRVVSEDGVFTQKVFVK